MLKIVIQIGRLSEYYFLYLTYIFYSFLILNKDCAIIAIINTMEYEGDIYEVRS